jgi:hypothetical protein
MMNMKKAEIDNLGIPPLAGIVSYEEAVRQTGYSVDQVVNVLKRLNYVKKRLHQMATAHLATTPEWEIKCALGYHLWLDSEHCKSIRERIGEMREPPLHLDEVPDQRLKEMMDEAIHVETSLELIVGMYNVIRTEIIRSIRVLLSETNPIANQPTFRILKIILMEEQEIAVWGDQAYQSLTPSKEKQLEAEAWKNHIQYMLHAAGGITQDLQPLKKPSGTKRSNEKKYEMDAIPRRDHRFKDSFNQSATIDSYYKDENRPYHERVFAMIYKRLREMDVPEWMAPILYKTEDKPWQYYVDLSRQLWDEVRHAMLGEIGMYSKGIPFYKYPVDLKASMTLNTEFTPLEAHLLLWHIEQNLMPQATGKQYEWEVAKQSNNPVAIMIQDYDWADEVLHAQIGRRWLVPEFGKIKDALEKGAPLRERWAQSMKVAGDRSKNQPWWPELVDELNMN